MWRGMVGRDMAGRDMAGRAQAARVTTSHQTQKSPAEHYPISLLKQKRCFSCGKGILWCPSRAGTGQAKVVMSEALYVSPPPPSPILFPSPDSGRVASGLVLRERGSNTSWYAAGVSRGRAGGGFDFIGHPCHSPRRGLAPSAANEPPGSTAAQFRTPSLPRTSPGPRQACGRGEGPGGRAEGTQHERGQSDRACRNSAVLPPEAGWCDPRVLFIRS